MNSESEPQLEESVQAKLLPILDKIKLLEESVSQKDGEIAILKLAYERILEEMGELNKNKNVKKK